MTKHGRTCITLMITAAAWCSIFVCAGCEGSEAKKEVTKTVEQAVGAETAKKGRAVKQAADQIMRQEMERAAKGLEGGEPGNQGAAPKESPETEQRPGMKE